jgi:GNAT superfamily N-acetyltransferase
VLIRLGADDGRDVAFDCGDGDLNQFFFNDSREACVELVSVTYAWIEDGTTVAFFSVSNDAISRMADRPAFNRIARRMPREKRYPTLPAVKIGRLAVDKHFQSNGLGREILDFIKDWFTFENKTGCRFVIVDALNKPNVLRFYQKNGFAFLSGSDEKDPTRLMYFDLILVKR